MGTYLVTGGSGGFGSRIVDILVAQGQSVIAPFRSDADLSEMADINRLAGEYVDQYESLDGVILNAGVALRGLTFSSEGYEATFAVNHLGAFLLAHRLLPLLQRSEEARIVLVGSSDHLAVRSVDMDALAAGENYRMTHAYAASKAVAMAAMLEMSKRLRGRIKANVADPGWARTGLHRQASIPLRILLTLGRPMQNSPDDSARVITDLAVTSVTTGIYTGRKGPSKLSQLVDDPDFQNRCYEETAQLMVDSGFATPGIFLEAV